MIGQALLASIRKEALLLRRDPHALALLFAMPAVFILIMSLALEDQFGTESGAVSTVLVFDADDSEASRALLSQIDQSNAFMLITADTATAGEVLAAQLRRDEYAFAIQVLAGFGEQLRGGTEAGAHLLVTVAPETGPQREALMLGALREAVVRQQMDTIRTRFMPASANAFNLDVPISVEYLYHGRSDAVAPTSVQQNVPAWLVFAVFFVVMPVSNTMIRERELGMERRLRTTPVSAATILSGKLLPYFAVNQLQVVFMMGIGVLIVPLLGGAALALTGVPLSGLVLMAAALSVAALGYAVLIAVLCSSTEQATLLGGAGNIILAAIGGIMVPKFVMPPALQTLTQISPMAWGLDGFLVALLHGGGAFAVAPHAAPLIIFGLIAILLAWWLQGRRTG